MTTTLVRGMIVLYHGTHSPYHHSPLYIASVDHRGRLDLVDREYPDFGRLYHVRPANVTPTDQTVVLCACGHELAAVAIHADETCAAMCGCTLHTPRWQPPPGRPYIVSQPVPVHSRMRLYRWECASCGATTDGEYIGADHAVVVGENAHTVCQDRT